MNKNLLVMNGSNGVHEISLEGLQLSKGIIYINGEITSDTASDFISKMVYADSEEFEVNIYVNSIGGEVNAGLMIYDTIKAYRHPLNIYCTGIAASMAAIIVAGGQKGRRYILPHSKIMIHEPLISNGLAGSASSVEQIAHNIVQTKTVLNQLLARDTGKPLEEVNKATSFDNYMSAYQSIRFGICDKIVSAFGTEYKELQ